MCYTAGSLWMAAFKLPMWLISDIYICASTRLFEEPCTPVAGLFNLSGTPEFVPWFNLGNIGDVLQALGLDSVTKVTRPRHFNWKDAGTRGVELSKD
ncbi:predicted protein [Uncinocarpus reesii 1704]|uniref:Uncharacterized protein n=1 Tax=Uncinocarpus reesii (strain UAMH 1704) TaxID=336963 RepID=C4JYX7_UNCRE|nr:uncharacterized protein UREG_07378 [Uncinocarpus reesii 1704]EEP82513.1 predicted protein [Uncinocarpus reesii 1704]